MAANRRGRRLAGDLAILCRSCGLCCDGSLFGRARLDADEVEPARKRGLRVLASGRSFEQPCAALARAGHEGPEARTCSVYADRPRSCRAFACRLYERHAREGGPIQVRLDAVRRVRELLELLDAGGLTRAELVAELERRVEEDFARA